jgi:GntR family transcriptional regulator, transcriptional repressor for pyruvate dehydrogenase complex
MKAPVSRRESKPHAENGDVWQGILRVVEREQLLAGDKLPSVRDLARRLKVKPTLVRDALLQAQARGAVRIEPRVGAFMVTTSPAARALTDSLDAAASAALESTIVGRPHNLLHLLDARRVIEVELAGQAAERRRPEDLLPVRHALESLLALPVDAPRAEHVAPDIVFHTELAKVGGNALLAGIQATLMELLRPYLLDVPPSAEHRTTADRSHAAIYTAVVDGDAERARNEMRAHLSLAYDSLLRDLQRPPQVRN